MPKILLERHAHTTIIDTILKLSRFMVIVKVNNVSNSAQFFLMSCIMLVNTLLCYLIYRLWKKMYVTALLPTKLSNTRIVKYLMLITITQWIFLSRLHMIFISQETRFRKNCWKKADKRRTGSESITVNLELFSEKK